MEVTAVRIGFDMLAVQSPHHGLRGIGRYSGNLVSTLLERDSRNEYVLYVHGDLPMDRVPNHPKADVRLIRPDSGKGETMSPFMDRLVETNPDHLDLFVVLSPFENWKFYTPPARPSNGLRIVSILYDLIPFLFQDETEVDPVLSRHYRVLEELTRYDALLAISEATRKDCLSVLKLPPSQVVNISGASDSRFFVPSQASGGSQKSLAELTSLGIVKPFIFNVGGLDERKNTWQLIDSYLALPSELRESHQLVLTFWIDEPGRGHLIEYCRRAGLPKGAVIPTGAVSDDVLLSLYQNCEVFVFPSKYEGFGLPILEAMHCGAAVIAGNNSSQIEVVEDAGLLVNVSDVHEIASKVCEVLTNPGLKASLRERAPLQAAKFSWEATADRVLNVFRDLEAPRVERRGHRFDSSHSKKPRIAYFSPFPPRKSGISDYSVFLLDELKHHYQIDLYHDSGYVPEPALATPEFSPANYKLFDRIAPVKNYHAVVYQMGNSTYHSYMYDYILRHPGVVTLHDFFLAGFHLHYGKSIGLGGMKLIRDELLTWNPGSDQEINAFLAEGRDDWSKITRGCARRGWFLNQTILRSSLRFVVHSPWCREQITRASPDDLAKVSVIPHGIHSKTISQESRDKVRARFGIPRDALVFASFGFVNPEKMNPQSLDAFRDIAVDNEKALFLFVGEDADDGFGRRYAESLKLGNRVRFLGRQPADCFADLISITDIGVNLRLPPTNGETSGALLNLLASGVPTIVTEVGTFADYPSDVVRKVCWEVDGQEGLLREMRRLSENASEREALGQAAWSYVKEFHEWPRVAKLYIEAIEEAHRLTSATTKPGRFDLSRPHAPTVSTNARK